MSDENPSAGDGKSEEEKERVRRRRMLWGLVAAVAIWGLLLAIGSYLGIDEQTPSRDIRRFLVMAGASGLFLTLWVGALFLGKRRLGRRR